jgi:APOBEC-like N-terminal domain
MADARRTTDPARAEAGRALTEGKRRAGGDRTPAAARSHALLALQRRAGNAAVSALMAARLRSPGEAAVTDIDAALTELRRDEPAIDTVETGLKAAKAAGVPVELEGPKPPASALAVTKTGFGPESVAVKKPVQPAKPVPAVHPLGKAAAKPAHPPGHGTPASAAAAPPTIAGAGGAPPVAGPAPLTADQLLQPPVPRPGTRPEEDAAFTQVTGKVKGIAKDKRAHPPAGSKAREAQDAAVPPTDDLAGQAKAAKVDTMDAQPAGSFDKKAFIAAVKSAIEAKSPKTLKEADDFKESGKAGEVKGDIKGLVTQGKEGQAKDIETATAAPPDQSKAVPKPVTPMAEEQPGQVTPIAGVGAAPKPVPPEQVNLEAGKHQTDQEMADAQVTEPQLARSNEPEFQQALADKKTAAEHADTAPAQFREHEQEVIQQSKTQATAETTDAVAGMQGSKAAALAALVADKGKTKSKDETKRAEVTAKIQNIFAATEADVKKLLDGIDPKVEAAFEQGEASARSAFENYVAAKMAAYKEDRYSGWLGGLRWAKDKLVGMPDKVNEFYEAGRELYLKQMNGVITRVADIVGIDLAAAKQRIATGKAEIASYVKSLPADLKKVGAEASQEIGERFQQLESDVDAKQESVVDTLATKYVEARKGLDERIEELQAENKGLVDKAIGAIKAVINTIRGLISMLTSVLVKAANVVGEIIKDPVAFLGNLIDGVKGGILRFKDNILDHLRKGLMSWLFGALAEGGVELPETYDVKGIIKLLASIFGLTWTNIRNRIIRQIGAKAMDAVEKGVEIFQILAVQGVAGLWQKLLEKLGDIKEMILEQVKDFVITKIITAGITWLIGLLNPAAAFIKACKLIYDVIMFFVDNASRIVKFVDTVLDSVADIVRGNVGAVVAKIEDVLGQMVPIIIGFLASVIGLGGIGQKIREIIQKLQKPVNKAIDFVIKTGLKLAGPIIRGIKGISGKVKAKVAAGKAWVKGKVEAGKAWAKGKAVGLAKVKDRISGKTRPAPQGPEAVKQEARRQLQPRLPSITSANDLRALLTTVMTSLRPHGLHRLHVVPTGTEATYEIHAEASPGKEVGQVTPKIKLDLSDIDMTVARNQFITVAQGFIDRRDIGTGRNNTRVAADANLDTVEQQGRHAETVVLDKLSNMVMLERYPTRGHHTLELYVTRTPCNACATKIDRIRRLFEAGGGSLDVVVRALALYQGARDPARSEATGRGTRAGGTYSLRRLQEMQIRVEAWDLQRDARRLFGAGVDISQVAAVAGRLNGKVDQLRAVINSLPLIDVR